MSSSADFSYPVPIYRRPPEDNPGAFDRSCAGKIRYDTERQAQQVVDLERRGKIRHWRPNRRDRLMPYECSFCSRWHLGHE
jgi:hypothetical protein